MKFYGDHPADGYGYGKIVNEKRFDKLVSYLSQGKVVAGGEYDRSKLFIAPTILEDVALDAPVMQEEIFGPILPVLSFRTDAEAINIINRNPNPLSFYVFTGSSKKARRMVGKDSIWNRLRKQCGLAIYQSLFAFWWRWSEWNRWLSW